MVKILIDTCVWLDIAKDHKQQAIISVLDELINDKTVELIMPQIIVDEFERNKDRIIEESKRSLSGVITRVKEIVDKLGDENDKQKVLNHLSDIQHKSPLLGEYATQGSINFISTILGQSRRKKITNAVKLKAAERAIEKRAPFHRAKNNMADAVIMESFIVELNADSKSRLLFVTHNTEDFSMPIGNKKNPHPDFASLFSTGRCEYYISLSEALNSIQPDLVSELLIEREAFDRNPRTLSEILKAEDELAIKIWYNRHQIRKEKIEEGVIRIIEDKAYRNHNPQTTIKKSIWEGAKKSAAKAEKRFGKKNLLWDDFEWGMLNGKLSALRWVLGEDWDELDT